MNDIYITVYASAAYTSIEFMVTNLVTIEELCIESAKQMEKVTLGRFLAHEDTIFIREIDGTCLEKNQRIGDLNIQTGEIFYLI